MVPSFSLSPYCWLLGWNKPLGLSNSCTFDMYLWFSLVTTPLGSISDSSVKFWEKNIGYNLHLQMLTAIIPYCLCIRFDELCFSSLVALGTSRYYGLCSATKSWMVTPPIVIILTNIRGVNNMARNILASLVFFLIFNF